MKIKIEEKMDNPLFKRQEITFLVEHQGTATPTRLDVRAKLAAMLNCKEDTLYIIKLNGLYGQSTTQGFARQYPSKEAAVVHEQDYILKRHTKEEAPPAETTPPPQPEMPETKPEEPKAPPKEEKPKEALKKKEEKAPPKEEKPKEALKKKEEKAAPKKKKGS
ncbi:MAG: 30S ribosomal protein S24e [Promethearchaeota archaeon]